MNTPVRIPKLSMSKHFQLRMACKVADKSERGSTGILGAFRTFFVSVTGIKLPYEQKTNFVPPTGPAQLPGSYKEALIEVYLVSVPERGLSATKHDPNHTHS